jgi:predicted membrane channel-forming protein YqfA (hemolysin III family)
MKTASANIIILVAWALTIALTSQLLGGTFESGRSCQTSCVSMMYYGSIALAIIGTVLSFMQVRQPRSSLISKLFLLAGLGLIGILVGVMLIGTLTG